MKPKKNSKEIEELEKENTILRHEATTSIAAGLFNSCGTAISPNPYTSYTSAYASTTIPSVPELERVLFEIRNDIRDILNELDFHVSYKPAVQYLTAILEDIPCPTDGCARCAYYKPGAVDYCNTSQKIAEYLLSNNIVKLNKPKPLDKGFE